MFQPDSARYPRPPVLYLKHQSSVHTEADQKMFVTGKYWILVSVSDFPCIITLHFTISITYLPIMLGPENSRTRFFLAFSQNQRFNSGPNI